MAGKPVGPFVVLTALVGLAFAGAQAKTYELNEHIECSFALAHRQAPAADILFVGNSRTGSAIDPLYIEKRLERETGRDLSVERLTLALPDVPPMRVLASDYLRHRGYPKIVVLQLLVNYDATVQADVGKPVHPLRSIAFGQTDDLIRIQRETEYSEDGSRMARIEKGYLSIPATLIAKVTTNIYAALRWPARSISHTVVDCSGRMADLQNEVWRYGDLSDSGDYREEAGTAEEVAQWREESVEDYLPYDPRDPARYFETDQMHRLIASFRKGGARVFLTIYPQLSVEVPSAQRKLIEAEFPDASLIDAVAMAEEAGIADDASHYRDGFHVNRAGALVLSRGYAERLAEEIR